MFYALIGSLGPNLHFNDGMRDVVRLTFAPAPSSTPMRRRRSPTTRWSTSSWSMCCSRRWRTSSPERAIANAGSSRALTIAWAKGRPGQSTMQYEIVGSAYGGGIGHDGAVRHRDPSRATCTSRRSRFWNPSFPAASRASIWCRIPAAPAQWRGGLSLRREYELLEDATVIRRYDKARVPPHGIAGGRSRTRRPLRHQARHAAGAGDAVVGPVRDEGRRPLPDRDRGRRRLRRSAPARSAPRSRAISPRATSHRKRRRTITAVDCRTRYPGGISSLNASTTEALARQICASSPARYHRDGSLRNKTRTTRMTGLTRRRLNLSLAAVAIARRGAVERVRYSRRSRFRRAP